MSLYFSSLNSGSNGNCYYIGNNTEAVLIDAGLSCKETEKRMRNLNLEMNKIKAIFISHEHTDHVKGLEIISKKYNIPAFITKKTLEFSKIPIPENNIVYLELNKKIQIGGLTITPFQKLHDAIDPCSFIVSQQDYTVGVFTDIGKPCEDVIQHFKKCNAVFLEANYDDKMLETGSYPYHLKKRIKSDFGHLSNIQAMELFLNHRSEHLTHLLLSHLSKENNDPLLVKELFNRQNTKTEIIVASRCNESALYEIGNTSIKKAAPKKSIQLTIFEE